MKMSVYLQTATSHRGQRESRAIGQKLSRDNYQYIRWLTRKIFFSKTLAPAVATREQHKVPHGKLL